MKKLIYHIITPKDKENAKASKRFDILIISLIVLSIISIIIESFDIKNQFMIDLLSYSEIIIVVIFSLEYLCRLWTADLLYPNLGKVEARIKFIFSFEGIIDLLAILPFYLPLVFKVDLRFLRLMRLLLLFRILKLRRYSRSVDVFISIFKDKRKELAITGYITFLLVLVSSMLMYQIEHKVQPEKFSNIIETFWWSVATLTTVGYGDVYPITALGKILSGFIAILGIGLVALPTGIIGSGFIDKLKKQERTCPKCSHTFH